MTRDIEICYREHWQQHHWKTLQTAYSSSPFFSYYADIIQPLFETRETILIEHNYNLLKTISGLIGIDLSVEFTKDYENKPKGMLDLRSKISPKNHLSNYAFSSYLQVFMHKFGFMQGLSILDLLFNLGPESLIYLKDNLIREVDS